LNVTSRALAAAKRTTAARGRDESATVLRPEVESRAVGTGLSTRAEQGAESTAKLWPRATGATIHSAPANAAKQILAMPRARGIIRASRRQMFQRKRIMNRISGFASAATMAVALATAASAQTGTAQPTQRLQGTRDMHVACVGPDSGRVFQRGIGDSLRTTTAMSGDSSRVTGGTARSREYPDYDVVLDVPNLCVERIFLKVDSLTAKLNLDAAVSNLVRVTAGADVLVGNLDLTIQDVRARALLLIDLDDVVHVVDQTLTFVDNHPEVVQQLGSTLNNVGGAVGGLAGDVVGAVRGLVMSTTKLANGNTLQHVVDQATGKLLDRTIDAAGKTIGEKALGSVLDLATVKETAGTAANTVVRQVRDQAGNLIQFTLNKATNAISNLRIIK
jgi:hypothetical protein